MKSQPFFTSFKRVKVSSKRPQYKRGRGEEQSVRIQDDIFNVATNCSKANVKPRKSPMKIQKLYWGLRNKSTGNYTHGFVTLLKISILLKATQRPKLKLWDYFKTSCKNTTFTLFFIKAGSFMTWETRSGLYQGGLPDATICSSSHVWLFNTCYLLQFC